MKAVCQTFNLCDASMSSATPSPCDLADCGRINESRLSDLQPVRCFDVFCYSIAMRPSRLRATHSRGARARSPSLSVTGESAAIAASRDYKFDRLQPQRNAVVLQPLPAYATYANLGRKSNTTCIPEMPWMPLPPQAPPAPRSDTQFPNTAPAIL